MINESCVLKSVKRVSRYLDAHVMDGYKFLMQYYRAGDKICIFGMLVLGWLTRFSERTRFFKGCLHCEVRRNGIRGCASSFLLKSPRWIPPQGYFYFESMPVRDRISITTHRPVCSCGVTNNRFHLPTTCIRERTPRVWRYVQDSRKPFVRTSRLSFWEPGKLFQSTLRTH